VSAAEGTRQQSQTQLADQEAEKRICRTEETGTRRPTLYECILQTDEGPHQGQDRTVGPGGGREQVPAVRPCQHGGTGEETSGAVLAREQLQLAPPPEWPPGGHHPDPERALQDTLEGSGRPEGGSLPFAGGQTGSGRAEWAARKGDPGAAGDAATWAAGTAAVGTGGCGDDGVPGGTRNAGIAGGTGGRGGASGREEGIWTDRRGRRGERGWWNSLGNRERGCIINR